MKNWFRRNKYNLLVIGAFALAIYAMTFDEPMTEAVPEVEEEWESIRWKQDTEDFSILDEDFEVVADSEAVDTSTETTTEIDTSTEMEVKFYDVPLPEELQLHIFKECDKHNIAPAIVIAMIERESSYRADVLGDNGNSYGLMQIQPRWNQERMDRLGITDLLDPYQNVTVGIDLLAELIDENPDLYWVLMAYNGGQDYADARMESGNISDYATWVVERASELQK